MAHTVYAMWTVGTSSTSLLSYSPAVRNMLNIKYVQPQGWNVPVVVRLQDIKTGVDVRPDLLKQHQGRSSSHSGHTHQYLDPIYR